jgi:hypothetical protein
MLTNECQGIRKGWQGFGIPSSLTNEERVLIEQLLRKKGHERKQPRVGPRNPRDESLGW